MKSDSATREDAPRTCDHRLQIMKFRGVACALCSGYVHRQCATECRCGDIICLMCLPAHRHDCQSTVLRVGLVPRQPDYPPPCWLLGTCARSRSRIRTPSRLPRRVGAFQHDCAKPERSPSSHVFRPGSVDFCEHGVARARALGRRLDALLTVSECARPREAALRPRLSRVLPFAVPLVGALQHGECARPHEAALRHRLSRVLPLAVPSCRLSRVLPLAVPHVGAP